MFCVILVKGVPKHYVNHFVWIGAHAIQLLASIDYHIHHLGPTFGPNVGRITPHHFRNLRLGVAILRRVLLQTIPKRDGLAEVDLPQSVREFVVNHIHNLLPVTAVPGEKPDVPYLQDHTLQEQSAMILFRQRSPPSTHHLVGSAKRGVPEGFTEFPTNFGMFAYSLTRLKNGGEPGFDFKKSNGGI
ncbi:MAG: hypothetical protein HY650_01535 [Acidobacteria bacterium]|nr:hypothetical protein [Acidobacteriota bacterium]